MARKGRKFAHYEILSQIGAGGMGEVFLALDTKLHRNVAIKFLAREFAGHGDRLARFVREARAASALSHPNILTIHEIGEIKAEHYIVTEFIEGSTLRHRLSEGPLSLDEVLSISIQTVDALTAAHAAGITHRDIKPENLMLRPDGYLKVLDFGLAKLTESENASKVDGGSTLLVTGAGSFLGTVSYMSPEQARGKDIDPKSDIFSFGVVLYEMLTGHLPFPGDNPADVISGILAKEPAPLSTYGPDMPHEFQRIVTKALRKEREERYVSTDQLLEDLKNLRDDLRLERRLGERVEQRLSVARSTTAERVSGSIKDSVLLTDFENTTGESIFDNTLKTALSFSLAQSPFLDIVPDAKVSRTLRLMARPHDEPVTRELAHEICIRLNVKAFLSGTISNFGSIYVLTLEAVNAMTGESIGQQLEQAASREDVLNALSKAASSLRQNLGEGLSSIEKFDTLIGDATTSSLEALKLFSLGIKQHESGKQLEAVPFIKKAVEVDPTFASGYRALAAIYANTNQWELASEMMLKAYEFRDRVSESEKLRIDYFYTQFVTGDMDKAIETAELWRRTYPSSSVPLIILSDNYERIGRPDLAVEAAREGLKIDSHHAAMYSNLAHSLLSLGRYSEVRELCTKLFEKNIDGFEFRVLLYQTAFIQNDPDAMDESLKWFKGRKDEYISFDLQAGAAAFQGKARAAEELSRRAIELADRSGGKEIAARYAAEQALRMVFWNWGNGLQKGDDKKLKIDVSRLLDSAAGPSTGKDAICRSCLAMAIAGLADEARSLASDLHTARPNDTLLNDLWLPLIRATNAINKGNQNEALMELEITERFEKAGEFYPQYLRGLAYLQSNKSSSAAREFDKILENRGQAPLSTIYPLAQLGKARALNVRAEYEEFFRIWKDADPDMPALAAAKKEVGSL